MSTILIPLVVSIAGSLIAIEIDRGGRRLSLTLIRAASRLLPRRNREDLRDEWLDHILSANERGALAITRALSIVLIAVPLLAVGLRVGRRRSRKRA